MRAAANAVLLVLTLGWAVSGALRFAAARPQPRDLESHSYMGEILAHRISAQARVASYRMPLATLSAARLQYHAPWPDGWILAAARALLVVLLFAAALQLQQLGGLAAAGAFALLSPPTADLNVYADTGYTLLVLLSGAAMIRKARAPSAAADVSLAAVLGTSLLWRSPLAFLGPLLALRDWRRGSRRSAAILLLLPPLFLAPWLAMNWTVHRRVIAFERGAASSNVMTGALGLVENVEGDMRALGGPDLDPTSMSAVLAWSAGEVLRHPLRYAAAVFRRLGYALSFHPALFLLAAAGAWLCRLRAGTLELAGLAAYFLLLHCLMTVEERYFWPVWPPCALLASLGLLELLQRLRGEPGEAQTRLAAGLVGAFAAACVLLSLDAGRVLIAFSRTAGGDARPLDVQLDDALKSSPDDAWLLGERGLERLRSGAVAEAAADLRRAAELNPGDDEAALRLARAEALLGRPAALLAWAPRRPRADPRLLYEADLLRAGLRLAEGRRADAAALLKSAKERYTERNVVVRGDQGERGREVQERLRAAEASFSATAVALQAPRPVAQRRAFAALLSETFPDALDASLELASLSARAGDKAAAAAALERAAKSSPAPAARRRIAAAWAEIGLPARGLAALGAKGEDVGEEWLLRAELSAAAGDKAGAAAALARAEGFSAATRDEVQRLIRLEISLRPADGARAALRALAEKRPGDEAPLLALADEALRRGDLDEAAAALGRLGRGPRARAEAELSRRLLDRAERAGRGPAALEALARAEASALSEPDDVRRLVRLENALRAPAEATAALRALTARRPADVEARLGLADAALKAGELEISEAAVTEAAALGAGARAEQAAAALASAWLAKADKAAGAGRASEARAAADRAAALRPAPADALRAAELRGPAALEAFAAANPRDPAPLVALAALRVAKEPAAARALLERAEALSASDDASLQRAAFLRQDLGDLPRACALFTALAERRPKAAEYPSDLAVCEQRRGDGAAALAAAREAVRRDPAFLPAYLTWGALLEARGDAAGARAAYEMGLARAGASDPLRPVLAARLKPARLVR